MPTFLFTDIEGSTRLWQNYPEAMSDIIARHDALLSGIIHNHTGHVFKTVGDAICAVFESATAALTAAHQSQHALHRETWATIPSLRVRMALHTGEAIERDSDYFGPTLNHVARLLSAGHGGQVLLSDATHTAVAPHLPAGCELRHMGTRQLKDLPQPEPVYQLVADGLPHNFPPLKTVDARPNNLPGDPTPFLGRTAELSAITHHLRRHGLRLLTLTGPGGIGKTRLSLQSAAYLLDDFPDGVFYIPLGHYTDPAHVAPAVAKELGIPERPDQSPADLVANHLRARRLLLVMDNFEQILGASSLVAHWLTLAPHLKVLATSRERLNIYSEYEYAVPPLTLPTDPQLPPLAELHSYTAVALFAERARAARPDFALTAENAPTIIHICAQLDGLPLAIELAAARCRQFTPADILDKLADRLRLLAGGPRDLPSRQQSLRGAIAWSYDMLTAEEKTLFNRLAIFRGGWDLPTAEAICTDAAVPEVWLTLEALVSKSLVRELRGPHSGQPARYGMLETIAAYALAQLAISGEAPAMHQRHLAQLGQMAATAAAALHGPAQGQWLDQLEEEHPNLRVALQWALDTQNRQAAEQLAADLTPFWVRRGYLSEGLAWHGRLAALPPAAPSPYHAAALHAHAILYNERGQPAAAQTLLEQSLSLAPAALRPHIWHDLAHAALLQGQTTAAHTHATHSLALAQEAADMWAMAMAYNMLGAVALAQKEDETARAQCQQSVTLFEQVQDEWGMALALNNLGLAALPMGDYTRAMELCEQSLALFRHIGRRG